MKRILYLIDNLDTPKAGTEKQLMKTIELLDRARFQCTLVTLTSSPWLFETQLPCVWESLDAGPLARPAMLQTARRFAGLCRRHQIQLVQTFFNDSNIIGPIWAKLAGVDVTVGSRRDTGYAFDRKQRLALRFTAKFTDHIIANSSAAADAAYSLEGFDRGRMSVLPNILDVDSFTCPLDANGRIVKSRWGFPEDAIVVGAVANLRPIKNLDLFVRAAGVIASKSSRVRFVILGEGPQRAHLQDLIDDAGLQKVFMLPGSSNDVALDLSGIDVGVLVSSSESSPNALLEYMAAGRASVVPDVGGISESATHNETALFFPPDDMERLIVEIGRLINDAELRAQIGAAARSRVRAIHEQTTVIRSLENLYTTLIESSHESRLPRRLR